MTGDLIGAVPYVPAGMREYTSFYGGSCCGGT